MAYLRLRDLRDQSLIEFDASPVRVGRLPDRELVIAGDGSKVVSGSHAQFVHRDGVWWVEDLGGRNGTFVDSERLTPEQPIRLRPAAIVGLGERGPRYQVDALEADRVDETLIEPPREADTTLAESPFAPVSSTDPTAPMPGLGAAAAPPPPPAPAPAAAAPGGPVTIVFLNAASGERHEATGGRIRLGRGRECELRPVAPTDTSVSRVHCEIVLKPEGVAIVRDAKSRNGTLVNGRRLQGEHELVEGDRIKLGDAGPDLTVERLLLPVAPPASAAAAPPPPPPSSGSAKPRPPKAEPPRRSFAGKGRTVFIRQVIEETQRKSASRVRAITWIFTVLLVVAVGVAYWYVDRQQRATDAELDAQRRALVAQQQRADSVQAAALADVQRLSEALEDARRGSAPAAVVESLRTELVGAQERTAQLENALQRAQQAVTRQLAAGDSLRIAAQGEIARLRSQLDRASAGAISASELDSLRRAVRAAEERAGEIEAGLRAVRGADLAEIAKGNQAAVGLVSTFAGGGIYDGSGFVVTSSGYFVTNRHVVHPENAPPDSVFVTMADQRTMQRAEVVAVAPASGFDLAVLRIRNYNGPSVRRVDWAGTRARQGEPAALIGFPAGVAAALDRTQTVRTSMSAGIFSKVTPELIQFDGFTVGGSSGSPVFNAAGEVVAVHAAGLREAAGLGFTIPVRHVLDLLPARVQAEVRR